MAKNGQNAWGVPAGLIFIAIAAWGVMDLLGTFDDADEHVARRTTLSTVGGALGLAVLMFGLFCGSVAAAQAAAAIGTVDAIIASRLERAHDTAMVISEVLGAYGFERSVPDVQRDLRHVRRGEVPSRPPRDTRRPRPDRSWLWRTTCGPRRRCGSMPTEPTGAGGADRGPEWPCPVW